MKRYIKQQSTEKDEFDIAWEEKFGPEQEREFDSLDDFLLWMKEVEDFEVTSD